MVGSQTTLAVAPALYTKIQLDPAKDLTGMAMIGVSPLVAVVNANSPIHSIAGPDRGSQGQERHDELRLGRRRHHAAHGRRAVGVQRRHQDGARRLSRRGAGHQRSARRADPVHVLRTFRSCVGNVEGGKLRALAVTSSKRVPSLPDVPTIAETFPGFDAATWFALVAPAGHAARVRDEDQRRDQEDRWRLPDFQQRFDQLGMIPDQDRTPDEINAYIKSEVAKWAKVIKDAGVKPRPIWRPLLRRPDRVSISGGKRLRPRRRRELADAAPRIVVTD